MRRFAEDRIDAFYRDIVVGSRLQQCNQVGKTHIGTTGHQLGQGIG